MKTAKRVISVFLASLMLFSCVSAFAETHLGDGQKRTITSTVRFYRDADGDGEFTDETTKAAAGESVVARIFLESDFIAGAFQIFYLYTKNVLEFDADTDIGLNPEANRGLFYQIDTDGTTNAAHRLTDKGYLDPSVYDEYGSIYLNSDEGNANYFDGDQWVYEIPFTFSEDADENSIASMFLPVESRKTSEDPLSNHNNTDVMRVVHEEHEGLAYSSAQPVEGSDEYPFIIENYASPVIATIGADQGDSADFISASTQFTYATGAGNSVAESSYVTVGELITVNYLAPGFAYDENDPGVSTVWQIADQSSSGSGARKVYHYDQATMDINTTFLGAIPLTPTGHGILQDIPEGYYFAGWTVMPDLNVPFTSEGLSRAEIEALKKYMSVVPGPESTVDDGTGFDYSNIDGKTAAQGGLGDPDEITTRTADPATATLLPVTADNYDNYLYDDGVGLAIDLVALILPLPVDMIPVHWTYWEFTTETDATPTDASLEDSEVLPGGTVTPATAPEVTGYTNVWHTDEARNTPAVANDYVINAEKTFYGKYVANKHKITVKYSGTQKADDVINDVAYNSDVSSYLAAPAVEGYFVPSASQPAVSPALLTGNKMPDSDVTITFTYQENPLLTWTIGDDEIKSGKVAPGQAIAANAPTDEQIAAKAPAGKYFAGVWSSYPTNMPETATTVTGVWSDEVYTFSFSDNPAFPETTNTIAPAGVKATDTYSVLPVPENIPEGYSFAGYKVTDGDTVYDSVNAGSTEFGDLGENGKAISVYPLFTANKYTITYYDWDEATELASSTDDFGADIVVPAEAVVSDRTGYTFLNTWTYKGVDGSDLDEQPTKYISKDLSAYPDYRINSYKYIFVDQQQGTTTDPIVADYDTTITFPVPTVGGYEFEGWYIDEALNNKYENGQYPTRMPALGDGTDGQEMTLYAKFVPADAAYTITVFVMDTEGQYPATGEVNNMSGTSEQTFTSAEMAQKLNLPAEGFTVDGRSLSEYEVKDGTNYDLYIARNKHQYTLNLDGGAFEGSPQYSANGEYYYGAEITAPATAPVKANYNFKGWDKDLITEMPDEDVTITAQWKHYTEMKFYLNEDASTYETVNVEQGEEFTANYTVDDKEGCTFVGWSTDPNAAPEAAAKTFTAGTDDTAVYYPIYKVNKYKVTFIINNITNAWNDEPDETVSFEWPDEVEFDADGNAYIELDYGDDLDIEFANPTRDGYDFDGWFYGLYTTMPDRDITAEPDWAAHEHNIYFKWKDNDGVVHDMPDATVEDIQFGDPDVSGYSTMDEPGDRDGWQWTDNWVDEYGTYIDDYEYMPDSDLVFYAEYEVLQFSYTLDLDEGTVADGDEYTDSGSYDYGTAIVLPEDNRLSKAGFDFDGWVYTDENDDEVDPVDKIPAHDLTVTAQWDRHSYTIEYDVNGGLPQIPSTTAEFEDEIDLPTADDVAKEGSTLAGWKVAGDDTLYTSTYDVPAQPRNGDTIILKAQWSVGSFKITVDPDGGKIENLPEGWSEDENGNYVFTGDYGTPVPALDEPTKAGYDLAPGWSTLIPTEVPEDGADITVQWTKHKYTVVFLQPDDGATAPVFDNKEAYETRVNVEFEAGTTAPDEYPELTYYHPVGWATEPDGEAVDFTTWTMPAAPYDSDFYFYPVYERDEVKLIIVTDGPEIVDQDDTLPVNGFIYNAGSLLVKEELEAELGVEGNGRLKITPSKGKICGTGTRIDLIDNYDDTIKETYYLIVPGDVNGDASCNANDYTIAANTLKAAKNWYVKDAADATEEQIAANEIKRECYSRAADVADQYDTFNSDDTAAIELVILEAAEFGYENGNYTVVMP